MLTGILFGSEIRSYNFKMKTTAKKAVSKTAKKDLAASYNQYKFFQGKQYTGMAVGRSHKWYYDKGTWIDKKITPEKWFINYEVTKRRAGKAPEGSGVPVGTEYHWYIMAHQMVKKLDANSYSTSLNGLKFKLAHRRKEKDKWSISDKTQRNHLIKILKNYIKELESLTIEEFIATEGNLTKNPVKTKPEKVKTAKKAGKKQLEAEPA
jgi:hypothetical protein